MTPIDQHILREQEQSIDENIQVLHAIGIWWSCVLSLRIHVDAMHQSRYHFFHIEQFVQPFVGRKDFAQTQVEDGK